MAMSQKHNTDEAGRPEKVLLSFAGGAGHLNPCLPLVRALQTAGWTAAIAGRRDVIDGCAAIDAYFPYRNSSSPDRTDRTTGALVHPDLDHEFEVIGTYFAGPLARRHAEQVREIIDLWHPDLLVCDEMDFGAMVAAEHAGVARIVVNVAASGAMTRIEHVQQPLTLPMGVDQELNAERLTELGAGITLDPITVTSADIRETTRTALASKNLYAAAQRLQRENHDLPPVSAVLGSVLATHELTTHT